MLALLSTALYVMLFYFYNSQSFPIYSPFQTPIKFGKAALDKCAACGLPVYLAQRLMVSQKLYHRRCFRCSKCSGHLNPKIVHIIDSSSFSCDSCKNEKTLRKFVNNNDQIGMLAFDSDMSSSPVIMRTEEPVSSKGKPRPQSILGEQKIKYFNSHLFFFISLCNDACVQFV